jgi:hypothetical protein
MSVWSVRRDGDTTLVMCALCQRGYPRREMWPVPTRDGSPSECCYLCAECRGKGPEDTTTISAHDRSWDDFEAALKVAWFDAGWTPRTGRLVAGRGIYERMLRSEEDGPHTTLGGIGWVELALDETMDPWHARIDVRDKETV